MVFPVSARMDQDAVGQSETIQKGHVLRRWRFRWRVAAIDGERETVVGSEEVSVAIPSATHDISRCGNGNAGATPSGSGISWAFRVIATMV